MQLHGKHKSLCQERVVKDMVVKPPSKDGRSTIKNGVARASRTQGACSRTQGACSRTACSAITGGCGWVGSV
jgi:hypothetical protein